ncbi:MAG: GNAT family N-acetyltransferase [Chloroflexi bacterium]|nr:GNAT family N-acetyltransferase [Chloroflexota bacterium]
MEIINQTYPDEPTTVESKEHWERSYPQGNPWLRYVVESADGRFIGLGDCMNPYWMQAPGVYTTYIVIAPAWRRREIGQALLAVLEPFGRQQGAARLWADCREDVSFQSFGGR